MGSGETAPTMVEIHRATLKAAGEGTSLLLDTPYGFQENADDITAKAVAYFARSVGRTVTPLGWRQRLAGTDLDRALTAVRTARSVFAGPGSPTYALRVWAGSGFDDAVARVAAGGTVTFASAAALTIGVAAVPVYEIYKSGADPAWAPGMNLLERLTGLRAALIPHYDNTEGGTHSTRFCYLGERRLRLLEGSLPDGAHVIGVDEHTALVFDLAEGTASVLGNGGVTVRHDGESRVLPSGTVMPTADLARRVPRESAPRSSSRSDPRVGSSEPASRQIRTGESGSHPASRGPGTVESSFGTAGSAPAAAESGGTGGVAGGAGRGRVATSLREAADRARAAFDTALAARDAGAAAAAVLELEQAVTDWTADTLQSDDTDHARRTLRGMVLELAGAARNGLADPTTRIAPLVEAVMEQRTAARAARDWAAADALRDRLAAAGVEVRDGADGAEWTLRT